MRFIFSITIKIVKTFPFLLSGYCLPLIAAPQGEGAVFIRGEVLYTPCAIDLDSRDQTIEMGDTPVSDIATKGYGPTRTFTIRLINCLMLPAPGNSKYDSEYYQITFEPMTGTARFAIRGEAQGIELAIRDTEGNMAQPGVAFPAREVTAGSMNLNYSLQLVSNGQPLKAGDYQSLIRFRMDYY
ncbi:fimbrial protein [Raoultella ornithinolytica]|uniref:fimbrial protein n=1 Tax=Raoultella ornithinolytica TaxID=54291 RepID=UPI00084A09A7|nr:fimbrial protein [Raoultella ornithinolytica]AOO58988.1 fimbrial protein [Raoultella ornithinolytica]